MKILGNKKPNLPIRERDRDRQRQTERQTERQAGRLTDFRQTRWKKGSVKKFLQHSSSCFIHGLSLYLQWLSIKMHNSAIILFIAELFCFCIGKTWFLFSPLFLEATKHLYKRSCPSVRPSVRSSVRPSVRPSVLCYFQTTYMAIFEGNNYSGGTSDATTSSSHIVPFIMSLDDFSHSKMIIFAVRK